MDDRKIRIFFKYKPGRGEHSRWHLEEFDSISEAHAWYWTDCGNFSESYIFQGQLKFECSLKPL